MNCKTIHNKLIFFLERELPVSEMNLVREHLENCSECALFVDEMRKTLSILENDKITGKNPFFYTRVKSRMEKQVVESISAMLFPNSISTRAEKIQKNYIK